MPTRKMIHMTASDRLFSRNDKKPGRTRREIAAEAARIMVTQSQSNFRIAKQKAAQRLGIKSRAMLPRNVEVEAALKDYQGFYGGKQHIKSIQAMRTVAARVMRALESFRPRLVGQVLEGTADKYTRISLHVFCDPTDKVTIYLLEHGLNFQSEQRMIHWRDGSFRQVPLLVTHAENLEIELALFSAMDLRQAPVSAVDGRPLKRASLSEVECLLAGV